MDLGKELELRIADVLYFSPRFPFANLNVDDPPALLNALQDRVEGFYLQRVSRSLASGDGFAGGLICCAAIEFLAIVYEEKSPSDWLRAHLPVFGEDDGMVNSFGFDSGTAKCTKATSKVKVSSPSTFQKWS
jgi:hypothetical protein